jgi:hypothetical protein
MVEAPSFLPAKLPWAEVRLDLGDAAAAAALLEPIVAHAPEDVRARFLLEEAAQALAADPRAARVGTTAPTVPGAAVLPAPGAALASLCGQNGVIPPYVVAGCAVAASSAARAAGDGLRASTQAQAAARTAPDEPRLLARAAQLLALEGFVDKADKLVERAARFMAPQAPELAWARLAVTLGHGRAAAAPPGLRPVNGTTRVIAARAAFAAGGAGGLAATLDTFGREAVALDADLRLLETLDPSHAAEPVAPAATAGAVAARAKEGPAEHYVDGLRARLAGDSLRAAEHLSHALSGHADACRAAGEYVATLRALKRHPDAAAFASLRAENSGCVNLPAAP